MEGILMVLAIILFFYMKNAIQEKHGCGGCMAAIMTLLIFGLILFVTSLRF